MKCNTVIALQHGVHLCMSSPMLQTFKEGVKDILPVQGQVQRRRSSENVLVDHRLCVRRGQLVCMGVALPVVICTKAG